MSKEMTFLGRTLKKNARVEGESGESWESPQSDGWPIVVLGRGRGGRWFAMAHFKRPCGMTIKANFEESREDAERRLQDTLTSLAAQLGELQL